MLVALATGGCATWQATDMTPRDVLADGPPPKVRVTTRDGDTTVLERPRVLGDVVAGIDSECAERFGMMSAQCPEMGVAVFEIETFEVYKRGAGRVIIIPAVLGLGAAWLLANRDDGR